MTGGNQLVLITGATGQIGYAVLVETLKAGYNVRVALRDPSKAETILTSSAIKAVDSIRTRLSFVQVSDITQPGAYDEALEDTTHVIHVASPLARRHITDVQSEILDPAVKGTTGLLNSAVGVPSVKRIVMTSSVNGNVDTIEADNNPKPVTADYRRPDYPAGFAKDRLTAYNASKVAALNATDAFVREKRPQFDVINIMPAYVFGRKGLATSPTEFIDGSNFYGIGLVLYDQGRGTPIAASSCHVDDVAEAHVRALDPSIAGGQNFALVQPFEPSAVWSIVRERFPKAVQAGIFGDRGSYPWHHIPYDARKTEERLLGRKFKGLKEQIVDSAEQFLELLGKEKA